MVTMLYECGRLSSTVAVHDSALDEALAGEIVNVAKPTAETTTALSIRPIFTTRSRFTCLIVLTVLVNAARQSSARTLGI
jgi:hypothetical protein